RGYLRDSESAVPPTTARIMQALREEPDTPTIAPKRAKYMLPDLSNSPGADFYHGPYDEDSRPARSTDPLMLALSPARRWLRNGLTLATIVALIFTAVGVFSHYLARSVSTLSGLQTQVAKNNPGMLTQTLASPASHTPPSSPGLPLSPTAPVDANQGWNGLVLITSVGAMYSVISTYNYLNGDHRDLAEINAPLQFDGVGSYGQNMLYQVNVNGQTLFYTLDQLQTTGYFYELDQEDALNALWLPDNQHVLVATSNSGVIMVDTLSGQSQPFLPDLQTNGLKFYRDGYLYFLGGADRVVDALYRINVGSGLVQQVAGRSIGGNFWLSPDGQTVYYNTVNTLGIATARSGIYAASSDGAGGQVLRPDGQPIGYAPDDSLVVLRQIGRDFEVVQLGATPAQDRLLFANAAPGATSLCVPALIMAIMCGSTNIALAPLSHALAVIASYPDGSRKVWSDDLVSGKQMVLMQPASGTNVMVPGWDRIAVA
ncbi:MAG TPA: hypothetical protein VGS41_01840, partial [Chthonomonadales bacterium]|nr:hypothetical protein [Chthonomonadales bacterium]